MSRYGCVLFLLVGLGTWVGTEPGRAEGDVIQELTVQGPGFGPAGAVTAEPQSLNAGLDGIVFRYALTNTTPAPVTAEVTLKLPTVDLSDPDASFAIPADDPVNFLGATVTLDAAPLPLSFRQTAWHENRDVTRQLRDAKLPLLPGAALKQRLAAVAPDLLLRIVADGLLKPNGTAADGTQNFVPAWTVKTVGTGRQRIEPGRVAVVEARLKASLGASQDSVLRKAIRQQDGMGEAVAALRKRYCVEDGLVGGIDRIAGSTPENSAGLGERRLAVRLPTVAAGTHPAFQVTLDKGAPDNLVSTCLNGLRKAGPTLFVREATSGDPTLPVLQVLVLGRFQ